MDESTDSKSEVASEDSDVLGLLMRHLLPTPAVSPPRATPIPSDRELLIQRLMAADRQEPSAVCFSCGWSGHAASRCPVLDLFPFLSPGWQVDRTDEGFILRPPRGGLTVIQWETSTDLGRMVGRPDQ